MEVFLAYEGNRIESPPEMIWARAPLIWDLRWSPTFTVGSKVQVQMFWQQLINWKFEIWLNFAIVAETQEFCKHFSELNIFGSLIFASSKKDYSLWINRVVVESATSRRYVLKAENSKLIYTVAHNVPDMVVLHAIDAVSNSHWRSGHLLCW